MGFITDSRIPMTTTTTRTAVGEGEREVKRFPTLNIILVSFGAVLFFIMVVVIITLIKSRRKIRSASREQRRNHGQPPIYVIGQNNRHRRGGDNPAFCPPDESSQSGRTSSRTRTLIASPYRLPTYDEVMAGREPPSNPVSRSDPMSNAPPPPLHHAGEAGSASGCGETGTSGQGARSRTPPPRYAYEYPSCFWEEVPPPPYSSGNWGMVRAMGGIPGIDTVGAAETTEVTSGRRSNPSPPSPGRRAPLAVPTPTALSPAPSPSLPARNHALSSSSRRIVVPPAGFQPHETTRPLASSSPAVPRRGGVTPSAGAVGLHPGPLCYVLSTSAPTTAGNNADPRINGIPTLVAGRSGLEVHRSQGHYHGNVRPSPQLSRPAGRSTAPLARFDIEL